MTNPYRIIKGALADDMGAQALQASATARDILIVVEGGERHAGKAFLPCGPIAGADGSLAAAASILWNLGRVGAGTTEAAVEARDASAVLSKRIDDMARRIVGEDVRYCVSSLVSTLAAREWDGSDGIDPDDLQTIMRREPGVDDYIEAARDAKVYDCPIAPGATDLRRITVETDQFGVWCFTTTDEDGDEDDRGTAQGTELSAWRAAFDSMGLDHPDGTECLEHWLVTDDMARRLRERGEAVADDIAGLTIWGRCTSGQAIYADSVMQDIARGILEA